MKHYFLLAADALPRIESIAGALLCFMELLPCIKVFQGEGGNITFSSLHMVALKNRLINQSMPPIGAQLLLWPEAVLGSQVVLHASAGGWLHAAAL